MCIQTFESPHVKWKQLGTLESLPNFEVGKESGDILMHFTVPLRDGIMKVGIVLDGITNTEHTETDILSSKDLARIIEEELSWFQTKNKGNINRETIGYFLLKIHEKLVAKGIAQGFFERATAGMFFHLENRLFMVRAADTKWNVTTYDEKIDDIVTLSPPPNHIEHFDDPQVGHSQAAMLPGMPAALLGVLAKTAEENVEKLVNSGEKYNRKDKLTAVAAFGHSGPIEKFVDIDEIQIDQNQPLFVQISSDGLTELSRVLEIKQPWMLGIAFALNSYASRIDPNQGRGKNSAKVESKVAGSRVLRPETFFARQLLARPFAMAHLASLYLMMMGKVPKDMDYRFKKDDTCLLFYRSESFPLKAQQAFFKHLSAHSAQRGGIIHDYKSVLDGGWQRFTTLFLLLTGTVFPEGKLHELENDGDPTVLDLQAKEFIEEILRTVKQPDMQRNEMMKLMRETLLGSGKKL